MHSLGGLGVRGGRWRSGGGALRSFLRLGIEMHSLAGLSVQDDRWWSLCGALRSFLRLGVEMHFLPGIGVRGVWIIRINSVDNQKSRNGIKT